ncbi:MAG: hypothetical protein AAF705_11600, partial [Bacteroidota bacterium]
VVQDSKYLEREKHQTKRYFTEVIKQIKDADQLMIFGPADIDRKLQKELALFHKELSAKVVLVKKADSMTLNQTKALIRNSFSKIMKG